MAAYTSLLLVIALCATTAYSLQCYTCDKQSTNAYCQTATTCDSSATSCMTTVGSADGYSGITVSKQCAPACSPTIAYIDGVTVNVTCCSTDLCNTSGGISIKSGYSAILLALGSILTILKTSLL